MFIPVAVVARARELIKMGLEFSRVLRALEVEGNGAWPRKTMQRRVAAAVGAAGQNPARARAAAAPRAAPRGVAKTTPLERLEAAAEAAEYNSPAYHRAMAALHAAGGPCGCYSCGHALATKGRRAA